MEISGAKPSVSAPFAPERPATDVMGWDWGTALNPSKVWNWRDGGRPRSAYAEQSPQGGGHAASSRRCPCRRADPGAARRPGRRPRGLVGQGLLPPGGRGGQGDHRRLRAGDRQAGRARPLSLDELPDKLEAALEAGQPPDFAFGVVLAELCRPVGGRGPAGGSLRRRRRLLEPVRSGCARLGHLAQCADRAKGAVWAAVRPRVQPRPRLEEPLGASGLHPRRHPARVGGVLVVLVRPGAAGGAQGAGPRRHLGRRPADVGAGCRHRQSSSSSSWRPTTPATSPGTAGSSSTIRRSGGRLIKAIDSYTAIYRKGCTPPDSVDLDRRRQQQGSSWPRRSS